MKNTELEVWIGHCAKKYSGSVDSNLVNVAIKGLSFVLPNVCNTDEPVCFEDYKRACFYIDDWSDVICSLSSDECVSVSCKVHLNDENNVRTLSAKVCGDILECLADGNNVDFAALDGSIYDMQARGAKKTMTKFAINIGTSCMLSGKICEIRDAYSGTPHGGIFEEHAYIGFDDFASLKTYMQSWCDVFSYFGRKASDVKVTVCLNIESLHRVYRFDDCMKLVADLEQSYTKSLRHFPV